MLEMTGLLRCNRIDECRKKRPRASGARESRNRDSLEVHASAELHEALLALKRVAGELRRLTERRGIGEVAAVAGVVSGVEDVEDFGQHLDAEASGENDVLGKADVELREGMPPSLVDVSDSRWQVDAEAVAVQVLAGVDHEGKRGEVTVDARDADPVGRRVSEAEGHAVVRIGVEGTEAGAALRVERVDRNILFRAPPQVRLEVRGREPELVGADQNVAARYRVCVEALQQELVGRAGVEAEIDPVIVGLALPVPDAEVAEFWEAALTSRGVFRVASEAVGQVAVLDVHEIQARAQPVCDLVR